MSDSIVYSDIFSVRNVIIGPAVTFGLTMFVAGFYVLLFGLSTYLLCKRRAIFNKKLHLGWTAAAFFVSNIGALAKASGGVVDTVYYYEAVRTQDLGPLIAYQTNGASQTAVIAIAYVCYIIANCIADAILIHRCYILYESRKAILLPLVFMSFATNAVGIVSVAIKLKAQTSDLNIESNWELFLQGTKIQVGYYCANAGVNGLLTLILAGRIWWMGKVSHRSVAAIILESGMLYPATLITHAVLIENTSKIGAPIDLTPIAILMAGIAPTLMNVRISTGKSVETYCQDSTLDGRNLTFNADSSLQSRSVRTDDLKWQY